MRGSILRGWRNIVARGYVAGMLTTREVALRFGVSKTAVQQWGRQGLIRQFYQDELKRGLWQLPSDQIILKGRGGKAARPARLIPITAQTPERGAI